MSVSHKGAASAAAIDALSQDNAELRASVAALTALVAASNSQLTQAVQVALAPKTRAPRAASAPATVSEADRVCAEGGFRRGYRARLVRDLLARGCGVHVLATVCESAFPGYPARSAIPVAQAVARRLSRLPRCGYTLVVDVDESDAGKTELVFALRTASDPVSTETDTDSE
jgi:hypothetical protein